MKEEMPYIFTKLHWQVNAVYINEQQEYQYMRKKMTFNIRYTVIHEARSYIHDRGETYSRLAIYPSASKKMSNYIEDQVQSC